MCSKCKDLRKKTFKVTYMHRSIYMFVMNINVYVEREGPNGEKSLQNKSQDFGSEIRQYIAPSFLTGEIIY